MRLILASLLACSPLLMAEDLTATREGKQVVIRSGKAEILRYQAEGELARPEIPGKFLRGGYVASLSTPAGKRVTDDYPANHMHHHGVWTSWTKTSFQDHKPDFWNMGDLTGKVDFVSLDKVWQKDGKAGLTAKNRYFDLTSGKPIPVLEETVDLTVSTLEKANIVDFTITQTSSGDTPLSLLKYHYGGFGFRGNFAWNGKQAFQFLGADGETDRVKINTTRQPWCWVGGELGGDPCGVTLMGHPSNFRAPQPVRANPDEPFFCFAPPQLGDFEIAPGKPLVSRYRLVVSDGRPDKETASKWWEEYSRIP